MERRTLLAGALAAGASVLTGGLAPSDPVAAAPARRITRAGLAGLHEAMAARVARGELVGIAYAVVHRGVVHVSTIGTLTLDGQEPVRRGTPFRLASLTKPILAAATMMLVEDGTLALDEPVDRLLPELANRRVLTRIDGPLGETVPALRPITVEDLLSFRMGYGMTFEPVLEPPDYPIIKAANELELTMGPPDPRTPHDPDEWIRRFGTLPLMSQPGERWRYNAGSLVLSVLVARAAGRPLADLLRSRIFRPLGMRRTAFSLPAREADRLPGLYLGNPDTGRLELVPASPPSGTRPPAFPSGAAGLASTIDDYLTFSHMLLNRGVHHHRRLLSTESVRLLTTNHLTPEQVATAGPPLFGRGWGYGMAVTVAPDEISPAPGRYGWEGGYGTAWYTDPNRDLIAIALTQTIDFLFNGGLAEFQLLAADL